MTEIEQKLKAPFPEDRVKWRIGRVVESTKKGMMLAYIDARDVMDRLDEVVGFGNWSCEYTTVTKEVKICRITINIPSNIEGMVTQTYKTFYVEDGAENTDFEAEKGGLSDSFKRAGVKLGIGRYLYDCKPKWVDVEKKGKTWVEVKKNIYTAKPVPEKVKQNTQSMQCISSEQAETWRNPCLDNEIPPSKVQEFLKELKATKSIEILKSDLEKAIKMVTDFCPLVNENVE